ncbi:MAG: hypothetical protein M3Y57_17620 [Acidobacteriota bacterium]|nr:hypothetical protein [Acidobacteriota bacterium]
MIDASSDGLVEQAVESWHSTRSDFPELGRRYSAREQQEREYFLDDCLDRIERELFRLPRSSADAELAVARLTTSAVKLATCALGIDNSYIDSLLREGFSAIGVELARSARLIDPEVSMADVLQACRNAWTAGALQLLFGRELRLTPALFAYSMLYPYSDKYLDDRAVPAGAKLQFSHRFRERLAGVDVAPHGVREETIWDLVGLIETQYPRENFPGVYDSLLAIHRAQQDSIGQMQRKRGSDDFPVLRLSVTKGGTSVVADAYLATGTPTFKEVSFAFNWGVLLQLSDDLQDLRADCRAGSVTVFSKAVSNRESLDELTNRTFHFSEKVLGTAENLAGGSGILKQLLTASSRSLLIRSVACLAEYYADGYARELEAYSPFRFGFLRSRERQFSKRQRAMRQLFEMVAGGIAIAQNSNPVHVDRDGLLARL